MGQAGAAPPSPRWLVRGVLAAFFMAVAAWILSDLLRWVGSPPVGASRVVTAHVLHLLADTLLLLGVVGLARVQRPRRWRGEGVEALLVLLGIAVPTWLLWLRPTLNDAIAVTAGGRSTMILHLVLLFAILGAVVFYVVGDVRIEAQDEAIRGALVVVLFVDLGPPLPGGADPGALVIALEVIRLCFAAALAVGLLLPSTMTPRPLGRRHWHADRRRVLLWAVVALVGPVVLAGGAVAGARDSHALVVAAIATVLGVGLLSLREWVLVQDAGRAAGRASQRADRQSRLARRLTQREQARTTFLSAASHDLRTPLMAVRGSAELLATHADRLDDERRATVLASLVRNADRLEHLLTSLLDVERLTSGAIQARRERVDADELVRGVVALPHLRDAPIEVTAQVGMVRVDPMMLERILDNLCTNAVRHTPEGTRVWVTLDRRGDDGVRVTVGDAGPGIAPEDRARVLEAFTRLDQTSQTPGSGLGLSLVAGFASLHGGSVVVRDREGGGAEFVVELPGVVETGRSEPRDATSDAGSQVQVDSGWTLPEPLRTTLDTALATALDDEQAVDRASRTLLRAGSVEEVVGVLLAVVHHFGGTVASPSDTDRPVVDLDLALGQGPSMVAVAPAGLVATRLQAHLPTLVEDARHVADLLRTVRRRPPVDEVRSVAADDPQVRQASFRRWAEEGRVTECVDLALVVAGQEGSAEAAVRDLLVPVQEACGRGWQDGRVSVAREHAVTSVVDIVLGALEAGAAPPSELGRLAVVCATGEEHLVAARMAALVWRERGWRVHLMGSSLHARDVHEQLAVLDVGTLAVSCSLSWCLPGAHRMIGAAHDLGIPAVLGGAAGGPDGGRPARIGADGWAHDARALVGIVEGWAEHPPALVTPPLHPEITDLDERGDRVIRRALGAMGRARREQVPDTSVVRHNLEVLLASAGAAVQVEDADVLDEVVDWLDEVAAARGVPSHVLDSMVEALAEALPSELVRIRGMLDTQVGRVRERVVRLDPEDSEARGAE